MTQHTMIPVLNKTGFPIFSVSSTGKQHPEELFGLKFNPNNNLKKRDLSRELSILVSLPYVTCRISQRDKSRFLNQQRPRFIINYSTFRLFIDAFRLSSHAPQAINPQKFPIPQ